MKDFLVKAILQPFASILFCLVFGVRFVYASFQTVSVDGGKDPQGQVTIDFNRKHFLASRRLASMLGAQSFHM